MALFLIGGMWFCSLLISAGLGWQVARWTSRMQATSRHGQEDQQPPQAVTKREAPLPPTPGARIKRAHVFDEMPPVEVVRAEAMAILKTEKLWDRPGALDQLEANAIIARGKPCTVAKVQANGVSFAKDRRMPDWSDQPIARSRPSKPLHVSSFSTLV